MTNVSSGWGNQKLLFIGNATIAKVRVTVRPMDGDS